LVGSVAGVVAVQILALWGRDYLLFKGAGGGALSWVICYATLCKFLSKIDVVNTPFLETQISLLIHIIFGLVVVVAAVEIERRWPGKRGKGKGEREKGKGIRGKGLGGRCRVCRLQAVRLLNFLPAERRSFGRDVEDIQTIAQTIVRVPWPP